MPDKEQVEVIYSDGTVGYLTVPTEEEVQAEREFTSKLWNDLTGLVNSWAGPVDSSASYITESNLRDFMEPSIEDIKQRMRFLGFGGPKKPQESD